MRTAVGRRAGSWGIVFAQPSSQRYIAVDRIVNAVRRQAIAQQHEVDAYAVVLVRHASLPRTTSGKMQRQRCREHYLQGRLKLIHQWVGRSAVGPHHFVMDDRPALPLPMAIDPQT